MQREYFRMRCVIQIFRVFCQNTTRLGDTVTDSAMNAVDALSILLSSVLSMLLLESNLGLYAMDRRSVCRFRRLCRFRRTCFSRLVDRRDLRT